MKIAENIEWRIVDNSLFIVNTNSNKVFCGNESVKMVFQELLQGTEKMDLADKIINKYQIDSGKYTEVSKDILDIIDFLKKEEIIV